MAGYNLSELESVYDWLLGFIDEHAYAPTLREIAQAFNMSPGRVDRMLTVMERRRWLFRHGGKRQLQVLRLPARNRKLQSLEHFFQGVAREQ